MLGAPTEKNRWTMIHITSSPEEDFTEGVRKNTVFARLADVSHMTIWQYKTDVVLSCAAGFAVEAQTFVVVDGKYFSNPSGIEGIPDILDATEFGKYFKRYYEGNDIPEYKNIRTIPRDMIEFIRVRDWRTHVGWYLTREERKIWHRFRESRKTLGKRSSSANREKEPGQD